VLQPHGNLQLLLHVLMLQKNSRGFSVLALGLGVGGRVGLAVPLTLTVVPTAAVVVAMDVGGSLVQMPRLTSEPVVRPPVMHMPWLRLHPQLGALQSLLHKMAQQGSPNVVVGSVVVVGPCGP